MTLFRRSKAPLRISFAGGGSDIEDVYREIGGAVLVSTINKYSYVSISPRQDRQVCIRSLDLDMQISYDVQSAPAYDGMLDLAKACVETVGLGEGVDICIQTEAPPGSGLGSSSSMTAALLAGLYALKGQHIDLYELAEKEYYVERVKLGISGGRQDQYGCTFGGFNFVEFNAQSIEVVPLRLRNDILHDLESHCMLCYTGRTRLSANLIDKQVAAFRENRGSSREGTTRLRDLAFEAKTLLLRGRIAEFGHLLHEAGEAKKRMNPDATDAFMDGLYARARELGAFGGKILGAGGGGYMLLFAPIDRKHDIHKALEAMGGSFVGFSFSADGVTTWMSACP